MSSQAGAKGKRYLPRPYRITFEEGHELEDLEVLARRMSVGDLLDLMQVADLARDVADGSAAEVTEAHRQAVEQMITRLADVIIWWNVDEAAEVDGKEVALPVAPDEAGVRAQDFVMVMAIFQAYYERVTSVMPPLPVGSSAGPSPAELASIPTETPPPSLTS